MMKNLPQSVRRMYLLHSSYLVLSGYTTGFIQNLRFPTVCAANVQTWLNRNVFIVTVQPIFFTLSRTISSVGR